MRLKSGIGSDSKEGQEGSDQNFVLGDCVWTVAIVSLTTGCGGWIAKKWKAVWTRYTSNNTTLVNIINSACNIRVAIGFKCRTI